MRIRQKKHHVQPGRVGRCLAVLLAAATAQAAPPANPAINPADTAEGATLNLPEVVDLNVMIDYVSQRLGLNISFQEEQIANQRITLRAAGKVPATALLGMLEGMLRSKGLALIDGDRPGWKRIVPLNAAAVPGGKAGNGNPNQVVTQIFPIQNVDPARVELMTKPFLSGPTASSFGVVEQRLLMVTDYASNVDRISQMIRMIDDPTRAARVEFIAVRDADASQLAIQLKQVLAAKSKAQPIAGQSNDTIEVMQDRRTNQLIVVGPSGLVDQAAAVVKALDVPVKTEPSPIRFYKLANATAAEVLDTIRSLEGESSGGQRPEAKAAARPAEASPAAPAPAGAIRGGSPSLAGGSESSEPGAGASAFPSGAGGFASPGVRATANVPLKETAPAAIAGAIRTAHATVAADANTNTIIVIADYSTQRIYEQLIQTLDKRRPQVLVECTIVALNTSGNFSVGVELSGHSKAGNKDQVITFSNFGLSTPDPKTGNLALIPGVGFNGAVITSDIAQVIIRALSANSRAKVTSAPRVLVNDNATGTLSSLVEAPFTSTNIGNTISTTSFAGYSQAGTEITLTPHISEADYLQLEYAVALSSFQDKGDAAKAIPPSRQRDTVQSKVTIPDGSTVIVGGLNRTNFNKSIQKVPLLGDIPILEYLFSTRNTTDENVTLFVFLRPIILRDDQFNDLKFISGRDQKSADVADGFPSSEPAVVH